MNTENEIEHTPTPWELGKHGSISGGITRRYTNGSGKDQLVMVCCVQPDNGGTQQGNAAFIVRACNSHEALVAALKRISDVSTNGLNPGGSVYTALNLAKEAAQSALHNLK